MFGSQQMFPNFSNFFFSNEKSSWVYEWSSIYKLFSKFENCYWIKNCSRS